MIYWKAAYIEGFMYSYCKNENCVLHANEVPKALVFFPNLYDTRTDKKYCRQ